MQGTPEASGDFLKFFHREGQTRIPVEISARALRECFRSVRGTSLLNIYLANMEEIHALVRRCLRDGAPAPLKLLACDVHALGPAAASPSAPCDTLPVQARVQLNGSFSVEQLEAIARCMRSEGATGLMATPEAAFDGHPASSIPAQAGLPSSA